MERASDAEWEASRARSDAEWEASKARSQLTQRARDAKHEAWMAKYQPECATRNPLQCREIEDANTLEEISTGGDTIIKTSEDGGDPNNVSAQPSPRPHGTAAQSREIDTGIEASEARSRAKDAKPMMAQSREIEAQTTPEASNTGGKTNKPSDDEGDVFRIFTAPRNPAGTVVVALT